MITEQNEHINIKTAFLKQDFTIYLLSLKANTSTTAEIDLRFSVHIVEKVKIKQKQYNFRSTDNF